MVDLIPVLLLLYGLVSAGKPEWIATLDRYQKAAGTTKLAREIEMSGRYYAVLRIGGFGCLLFGITFTVHSL